MGNVNGRDEGNGSPSAVDEEEEESHRLGGSTGHVGVVAGDEFLKPSIATAPSELMAPSPPHSPRAVHSPLLFTPQVPVAPLRKPEELQIPNPSWMHVNSVPEPEDMSSEQAIPTMITWSYGGKEVAVEGSWDDWKSRKLLQRSGKDFSIMKVLPSGVYRYRFIVDGQRRYSPELPCAQDEAGNYYNVLDLQDYVPDDLESISGFEPPVSPDSSYNNSHLNSEDFAKEPPAVPPHLQLTLLNTPNPTSCMENAQQHPMQRPQHVILNHLYMQKGKSGPSVVALGSTHRFLAKYVTVVLYKSFRDI